VPVDVVVVTYQSERHLPRCLTALRRGASVLVVDNASTDRSADVAATLGARVVRNPENRGFAAAANQGARLGRADLILFLNPDAALRADDLDRLVSALDADPELFAVGPRLRHPDGTEQRAWWPFPSPFATWVEALGLHLLRPLPRAADRAPGFVVGACMLVRRDVFEVLGGFDERFWLYGEEADLCRRAWGGGWHVRLAAEATADHLGGASGEQVRGLAFEHFQRGVEHFILKHHGRAALVVHRVGLLVGSVLRFPLLAGQSRSGPVATARLRHRRAVARRLAQVLVRHPARVTP